MTESKKNEKNLKQFEQQIRLSSSIYIKKIKSLIISDRLHFADQNFIILRENFFNKNKRVIIEKEISTTSLTKKSKHYFD